MVDHRMPSQEYTRFHHSYSDDEASECDSDYTRMSLDSFFEGTGTSGTSVDFSMRSPSPAPSVFSMTSSLRAQAYKTEFGRGLNNYSDVYRLPADEEELERLGRLSSIGLMSLLYSL